MKTNKKSMRNTSSNVEEKTVAVSRVETFTRVFAITSIALGLVGSVGAFAVLRATTTKKTTATTTNSARTNTIASTAIPITGCKTITTSGSYILSNDLSGASPCLMVKNTANVTIDGNGKNINVTGYDAFYVSNSNHVTAYNFTSNGQVTNYGDGSDFTTLHHLTLGQGVYNVSGDDLTIQDSTFAKFNNEAGATNPLEGLTLQRNTIKSSAQKLVYIGNPPLTKSATVYECTRGNYLIEDNYFETSAVGGDEPLLLTVRCSTYATIRHNTFVATGSAVGIYLRDQSNNHIIENNTFNLNQGWGALFTSTGLEATAGQWPDPGDPSDLVFRNNVINNKNAPGVYLQAYGSNNTITNNTIHYSGAAQLAGFETTNLLSGKGNSFTHNTVYRDDAGATMKYDTLGTPATIVRDNIFSTANGSMYSYDHITNMTDFSARYSADHNLFQNRGAAVKFTVVGSQTTVTKTGWQTLATSLDAASIEGNPLFLNPTAGDFSLATTTLLTTSSNPSPAYHTASDGTNIGATLTSTTVADTTPPTVSITSPINKQVLKGATAQVTVTAADNVGVAGVTLYVNGRPRGIEDTTAPYIFNWDISKEGGFVVRTLSAVARDTAGNLTTAPNILVTINQMP